MASQRVGLVAGDVSLPEEWESRCHDWADAAGCDVLVRRGNGEVELANHVASLTAAEVDAVVLAPGPVDGSVARSARLADAVAGVREAGRRVVAVDPEDLDDRRALVHEVCDRVIHGRGRSQTWRWAIAHAAAWAASPAGIRPYGMGPAGMAGASPPPGAQAPANQAARFGELRLPHDAAPDGGGYPVVVLLHGGFWLDPWERDLMDGLAVALTDAGWATWNLEYRRRGPTGGGWPDTFEDAAAGIDALRDLANDEVALDLDQVVLLGHSAGATLAAWAATQTAVRPTRIVALAGVLDLEEAAEEGLGGGAVPALLGGKPADEPGRYAVASPRRLLPLGVPMTLVHGGGDRHVPVDHSTAHAAVARAAGDAIDLVEVNGADHFDVIDPSTAAGAHVVGLTID